MKHKLQLSVILSLVIISSFISYAQPIPVDSLYLGQMPPGDTPKIFIPSSHARLCISADGTTIYYSAVEGSGTSQADYAHIYYYKYFNNKWNGPFKLFDGFIAPTLSKNEDTLYTMTYYYQSYFCLKQDSVWSTPSLMSQSVLYYLQETNLGNYYCGSDTSLGSIGGWDLYKVAINNTDITYQNLGRPLNTINNDVEFFIAKDESYIVLGANEVPNGGGRDLYISYRKSDSTWTTPKSLGTLINNGPVDKWGPYVSADNKYLFYAKATSPYNIYWVRFDRLLDSLRYTNFPPYAKWPIVSQEAKVGVLFSFTVPDSIFYDEDHDPLTYSALKSNGYPLPSWLSFDPATRTFSGTPLTTTAVPLNIKVIATDNAQTSGYSVFSLVITDPTGIEDKSQLPKESQVFQNYPNPFNPTTVVRYQLSAFSNVKLSIYNLLGQKIKTLVNGFQSAGEHSVVWDATDEKNNLVASGMFFYRLEANNLSLQKKMILIK